MKNRREVGLAQYYETVQLYKEGGVEITKFCNVIIVKTAKDEWSKCSALYFLEKNGWVKLGSRQRRVTFEDVLSFDVIDHGYYEEWRIEISYERENLETLA